MISVAPTLALELFQSIKVPAFRRNGRGIKDACDDITPTRGAGIIFFAFETFFYGRR